MAQFNYGSNAGANPNTSGFAFGAKAATPAFGGLGATQPSGSITFGTPIASVAPTVQNPGLSFGTPTLGTGLNFNNPATPQTQLGLNFQTPAISQGLSFSAAPQPSFGATATQPSFGATANQPNFGATAIQPSFGATATQPSLAFGGTGAQPSLGFGAASQPQQTPGLSFGAITSSTAATPALSFGTPASSLSFGGAPAANTSFSLGGTTTSIAQNTLGGTSFGAAPISNTINPLGGINFGPPAASTGYGLGGSTATPALSFAPTSTAGLNFGLGSTASTAATPTLNFKGASTVPTLNFGFNTPAKSQALPTLTLGPPTSAPIGLGGIDSTLNKTGTVTTGRTDTVAAKENSVPNEIMQTIEGFKQFVKDQKSQSSDVSRGSARPFVKVREDIDLISSILGDVGNDLQRNQQQTDKLKHDSAKCLHNAEMAQRTNDTPPGLQFENTAPLQYFVELVNQFEQDLQALRIQIDVTDKHFQSLHEPRFLTSQELSTGMRRLHDTFVALAGRLHSVHTQVESQKEQYLNLRKYILKDPTNIFIKPPTQEEQALDIALKGLAANKSVSGPTPFSSFGSSFGISMQQQQVATKPPPSYPTSTSSFGFNTSSTSLLGGTPPQLGGLLFGNQTDASGFQLQNPPLGNKRGKR